MRVAELAMTNWMPFKGTNNASVDDGVYAVVASHVNDAGRSNWLGKTSFLAAVRFALFGTHPKRTEDEWITRGAPAGGVALAFDDGALIQRARQRGKSTQLKFTLADGTELAQDAAQKRICEHVGMTEEDFVNTCFFEQKHMSRLITATPADRMNIVAAWLNLEPLQRCEANMRERLSKLVKEDTELETKANVLDSQVKDTLEQLEMASDKELDTTIELLTKKAEEAKAEAERVQTERDLLAEWQLDADRAAEFGRIVEEGKALKAELDAVDIDAMKAEGEREAESADKVWATRGVLLGKVEELKPLARGQFDGACPVMDGFKCPAKDTINKQAKKSAKALSDAEKALKQTELAYGDVKQRCDAVATKVEEHVRRMDKLEALRDKAAELVPSHERIEKDGEPPEEVDTEPARTAANEAELKLRTYLHAKELIEKARAKVAEHGKRREEIGGDLAVAREALVIFGRNGAQKVAAETALSAIEAGANDLLRNAGIDLTIEVRWGREGKGLATHCDACGSPFPKSARAKQCAHCGEKRGKKTIDRLDIELSDRSGAAEDLAGVAFQLAAGAWLRSARSTPWSAAFIDEPFGALDETNRLALANHLTAMLRGRYGFEQAFVVAHDRGIMDAMPKRVEVVSDGNGSKVQVA